MKGTANSNPCLFIDALKGIEKTKLSASGGITKKALVTESLFEDRFSNPFVPEVKKNVVRIKKNSFKRLLIMDNAPVMKHFYRITIKI